MEALEVAIKKHGIHLDTSTSSLGQELSSSIYAPSKLDYSLNISSSSPSHEWLIDFGASYHMVKDKSMFSTLNDGNTKNIYIGDDSSLSVVGCCWHGKKIPCQRGEVARWWVPNKIAIIWYSFSNGI